MSTDESLLLSISYTLGEIKTPAAFLKKEFRILLASFTWWLFDIQAYMDVCTVAMLLTLLYSATVLGIAQVCKVVCFCFFRFHLNTRYINVLTLTIISQKYVCVYSLSSSVNVRHLYARLWIGANRKACWSAYNTIQPDAVSYSFFDIFLQAVNFLFHVSQ